MSGRELMDEEVVMVGDDGTPLSPAEAVCMLVDVFSAEDVLRRLAAAAVQGLEQGMTRRLARTER
jgi:hypothetical protein